jgi:mannose-6-phosphate isomerase-like protein (cupin superfamily)
VKSKYDAINPYFTRDGSEIRELMHPDHHPVKHQSLAEATIPPGMTTRLHRHRKSEEIYHITAGKGRMFLAAEMVEVESGDTILIPPGIPHAINNSGEIPLVILCACSPPYSHDDTEILEADYP